MIILESCSAIVKGLLVLVLLGLFGCAATPTPNPEIYKKALIESDYGTLREQDGALVNHKEGSSTLC